MNPDADPEIRLLVLQASPFCNLNCSYCYLSPEERADRARMSLDVVRSAGRFVAESGRLGARLTVLWHAGEPLALPVDYYREATAVLRDALPDDTRLNLNFQTNGIRIDDAYCDFFAEQGATVGVSVDGPAHVHDRFRVTRGGQGSHALTMRGIDKLVERGLEFGTISVITEQTLRHAADTIDFLVDLPATSLGFNVEEAERFRARSSVDGLRFELRGFVEALYAALDARDELWKCRELRGLLHQLASDPGGEVRRRGENQAMSIINVDVRGRVSTFSPELIGYPVRGVGAFTFGHVREGFAAFAADARLARVTSDIERGVTRCRAECGYFSLCGGGGPSNKLHENGAFDTTETDHCRFHHQVFADVLFARARAAAAAAPVRG